MLKPQWNVAFEIEVVLGDLGRFNSEDEPMDEATPGYCREVAKILSEHTGVKWSAPRSKRKQPGFYVIPEYDLDPLTFPSGCIAGVELLTPPLPLEEAEELRDSILMAICDEMGGWINFEERTNCSTFGWHINVDAGKDTFLNPRILALTAPEFGMLHEHNRHLSRLAQPLRHAYMPHVLKELSQISDQSVRAKVMEEMEDDLIQQKTSKLYAANFSRDAYAELRHFPTRHFDSHMSLEEILSPLLSGYNPGEEDSNMRIRTSPTNEMNSTQLQRYDALELWLKSNDIVIATERTEYGHQKILLNGQEIGFLTNTSGIPDLVVFSTRNPHFAELHLPKCLPSLIKESIAVIALSVAEAIEEGNEFPHLPTELLRAAREMKTQA